jgi:O-antigen/teichoic acid export membrane protein
MFRLIRSSGVWVTVGLFGSSLLSFAFQGLASHQLSDADFGSLSSAYLVATGISGFTSAGAQNAMLHLIKAQGEERSRIADAFMQVWLINSIFIALFCLAVAPFVRTLDSLCLFFVFSFNSFLAIFTITAAASQSTDDFRSVSGNMIGLEVIKLLALLLLLALHVELVIDKVYAGLGAFFFCICLVRALFIVLHARRFSGLSYMRIIQLGLPYSIAGLFFLLYYRSSVIVLNFLGLQEDAGALSLIYLFLGAILILPAGFSQRFFLGRWHSILKEERARFSRELLAQTVFAFMLAAPVAGVWAYGADSIIAHIYGNRYAAAREYAPLFALILLIRMTSIPVQAATSVSDLRWFKTAVIGVAAGISVITCGALAGRLGMLGAFYSGLAAEAFLAGGLLVLALQRSRL